MTTNGRERLSSLRAVRKVWAGQEISTEGTSLKESLSFAERLCSQFDPDTDLADAKYYTTGSLHVVLFERRARAADNVNQLLSRMHERMTAKEISSSKRMDASGKWVRKRPNPFPGALYQLQSLITFSDDPLITRATRVVARQHEDRPYLGTEISLVLGEGYAPAVLLAQSEEIYDVAQAHKGYGKLSKVHDSEQSNEVPILHFPFRSTQEAEDFVEMYTPHAQAHGLVIGDHIEWELKITPIATEGDIFGDADY